MIYIRNENKYDETIRYLYSCTCHEKAKEQYKKLEGRNEEELRKVMKLAHPDKRDGREDRRKEFEDALKELRRKKTNKLKITRRCEIYDVKRQMAEQYLSNVEMVLKRAQKPLTPEDFISSIHYTPCFNKVIEADMKIYGEGDLTLFEDIRRLSNL